MYSKFVIRSATLLAFLYCTSVFSADHYVSPTGLSTGNGSISNPWPLQLVLINGAVKPGDTVWLRGGVYKGKFRSSLNGASGNPIIVRSYPGEWARIDGNVQLALVGNISSIDTVLTLSDASLMVPGSVIRIDGENVYVKTRTGNTMTVVRGWGSVPSAHTNGAAVRMTGNIFTIDGQHTWYWGFEVMSSDTLRESSQAGSAPGDIIRGNGFMVYAPDTKLINLVVHDTQDAIGLWPSATNVEVHGCLVYHNGWQGPDRGHGHGLYIQNDSGTKTVSDVISFNNFATGMKAFGVTGPVKNVMFDGVTSFNNGSLQESRFVKDANVYVGTNTQPVDLVTVTNSLLYHASGRPGENTHFGFAVPDNNRVTITNNYIAGGDLSISLNYWKAATVTGNTIYVPSNGSWSSQTIAIARTTSGYPASAFKWNNNTYFDGSPAFTNGIRYSFNFNNVLNQIGGGRLSFSEWKAATGYDQQSQYTPARPTGFKSVVRPNRYEQGRGHITVFNWDRAARVDVSLSNVLQVGDSFEIRDAQNYSGPPVATGIFTGSPVSIPMNLTALSAPVGNVPTAPIHTAPEFGAFVVSKSNGGGSGSGISITVNPLSASLQNGGTQQFSANVTGATNNSVIWSLQPQVGVISSTGLYTAPSSLAGSSTVNVKATSVADPTKSATATISLVPATSVTVTVTPSSTTLQPSQKQQFAAQVTGSTNTGVTWSLLSSLGSISSAGLYTAPATITSTTTVTVKATSVADPTKSATATITLTKAALVISPISATVKVKNSQQFTLQTSNVNVTWSISPQQQGYGAIHQTGLYWAPDQTTTIKTVIVKATDVSDPTRYATATVTVVP